MTDISKYKNVSCQQRRKKIKWKGGKIMYQVSEYDRKELLRYLSKQPYIEVAPLISMLAAWKKREKEKNGKDKTN